MNVARRTHGVIVDLHRTGMRDGFGLSRACARRDFLHILATRAWTDRERSLFVRFYMLPGETC